MVLLTYFVLKPNFFIKKELYFLDKTKLLSQKIRLSNKIASNIQTVWEAYSLYY